MTKIVGLYVMHFPRFPNLVETSHKPWLHDNNSNYAIVLFKNPCVHFNATLDLSKSFGVWGEMKQPMLDCIIPTFKDCPASHIAKNNSHKFYNESRFSASCLSCEVVGVD
jgi:hypothetical protein